MDEQAERCGQADEQELEQASVPTELGDAVPDGQPHPDHPDLEPSAAVIDYSVLADMPDDELLYDLADLFKVFSDTTRIKILFSLLETELSVSDIADATATTQSAVSHQLRILKQAHLVKFRRDGRSILYSLADDHVYTMLAQGLNHICE